MGQEVGEQCEEGALGECRGFPISQLSTRRQDACMLELRGTLHQVGSRGDLVKLPAQNRLHGIPKYAAEPTVIDGD